MNINYFCAACEWLTGEGAIIAEAAYDGENFGHWFIAVRSKGKRRQAAWDGKDGWLYIRTRHGDGEWVDDWVGRSPDEQTVERIVEALRA
jgi:hypothetical protein